MNIKEKTTDMKKLNTENLPVTVNGAEHMVPKAKYAKIISNELSLTLKADISQKAVMDILGYVEGGKEISSENPEEYHKVYAKIKGDAERAQVIIAEAELDAKNKAEAEAEAKKQKEESELALANLAKDTNVAAGFATMGELFDLGDNLDRCVIKEGVKVTDEQLMTGFATAMRMGEFTNWAKGDLIVQLEDRGHEDAMVKYCEATGTPYQSVYRMAITARAVKPEKRVKGVSFTAYQEVATARLDKEEAVNNTKRDELIERVGKAEFDNVSKVRDAVREAAGKEPPVQKDPMKVDQEKDVFIYINYAERNSSQSEGLIKDFLNQNDIEVIHARTARAITDATGNRLSPLPTQKPIPVEAEAVAVKGNGKGAKSAAPAKKTGKKK